MISELKTVKCLNCGLTGNIERQDTEEIFVLSEDNQLKEQVFWNCVCKNCNNKSKILWMET